MRFLLANEFGAGRGHIVRLRLLAEAIQSLSENAVVRVIVPPRPIEKAFATTEPTIVIPDVLHHEVAQRLVPQTFPQYIAMILLAQPGALQGRLKLWEHEFRTFQPDVVVAEYAPTLSLAARGKVPCVAIGTGYTLPPPESRHCIPYRPLSGVGPVEPEDVITARINAVLRSADCNMISRLPQLNEGSRYGLMTIPLFDPYWEVRQQDYLGTEQPGGTGKPALRSDGSAIGYFSEGLPNPDILDGIKRSGVPTLLYVGKDAERLKPSCDGSCVTLVDRPFNLANELSGRSLVISQGSLGMATAAMYAGVPQLVFYTHDESWTIGKSIVRAHIGKSLQASGVDADTIATAIAEIVASKEMTVFSAALSSRYAAFRDSNPSEKLADIVLGAAS